MEGTTIRMAVGAFACGSLAAAARAVWCLARGDVPGERGLAVISLLGAAIALGHALFHGIRTISTGCGANRGSAGPVKFRNLIACGWLLFALLAVCSWPQGLDPESHPISALVLFGVLAALPAAAVENLPREARAVRRVRSYRQVLTVVALAVCVAATVAYLLAASPHVGGVDFFYYVCYARDMLHNAEDVPHNCYRYFPGVYAFWRGVMQLTDGSLESLQTSYVAVLAANSLLIAAVVLRVGKSGAGATYAAVWYLVLCSRFEGFMGTTEPIATLPFLAALWVWGGRPLQGKKGALYATAIGAGLGLALYTKQQAGLLSLGAVTLLAGWRLPPPRQRHTFSNLLLTPAAAATAFAAALLLEGKGVEPLRLGLQMVASYERTGSWMENLYAQLRNDESAALAAGLVAAAMATMLLFRKKRRLLGRPRLALAALAAVAGLATTLQFTSRAYRHYSLLTAPCLAVSAVVLAVRLAPWGLVAARRSELASFALLGLAALPLAYTGGNPENLHVWRIVLPEDFAPQQLWHRRADVAADLAQLREIVKPGEKMYVLPPRRNSTHFLLGTRSVAESGYGFTPLPADQIRWTSFDAVLLITSELDETDRNVLNELKSDAIQRSLAAAGFRPVAELPTMTLYRRAR